MNRIKILRKRKKLTQLQVGRYLDVGNTAVSMYETGQRHLDEETIAALCRLFGCSADYLIGLSNYAEPILSREDADLLAAYHAADDQDRKTVDGILEKYRPDRSET